MKKTLNAILIASLTGIVLLSCSPDDFIGNGGPDDEIPAEENEAGFAIEIVDQPLESLTTEQSSQELVEEAVNGNLYFNIHTQEFPGGEIRGQLFLESDETEDGVRTIELEAELDAAQEPDNSSDSLATGEATVTIVVDGYSVTYSSFLEVEGIDTERLMPVAGVSSIHLHNAPAGVNGPVIVDIVQDAGGDVNGIAQTPEADTGDGDVFIEDTDPESDDDDDDDDDQDDENEVGFAIEVVDQPLESLTTEQTSQELVQEALNGNLYFNIHTQDFPGGEIRGQLYLESDNTYNGVRTIELEAELDAAQEPDNSSDSLATGEATVTIVVDGYTVTYSSFLEVEGIDTARLMPVAGVSSIHLHNAPRGVNGPVIVDIVQDAGGDVNGIAQTPEADTGDGDVFIEDTDPEADDEDDDEEENEVGFAIEVVRQALASLTTEQTSQELVEEALNGNLYFNIHTQDFPGGEIRGQLYVESDETYNGVRTIELEAELDAAQEPDNSSDSLATGEATVTIVVDGYTVTYSSFLEVEGIDTARLMPVAGVSSIHLHNAPRGVNGPVIVDIVQDAGGDVNGLALTPTADTGDGDVFIEDTDGYREY